jgi:hypothetical protein
MAFPFFYSFKYNKLIQCELKISVLISNLEISDFEFHRIWTPSAI